MTMQDVVNQLAEKEQISKVEARERLNHLEEIIADGLVKDGIVKFATLGSIKVVERAARQCTNPKDRTQKINVPAKKAVKHVASKELDAKINA